MEYTYESWISIRNEWFIFQIKQKFKTLKELDIIIICDIYHSGNVWISIF